MAPPLPWLPTHRQKFSEEEEKEWKQWMQAVHGAMLKEESIRKTWGEQLGQI